MPDDVDPCLSCPLPDCDEDDPRCGRRLVPRQGKWRAEIERVLAMGAGERVVLERIPSDQVRLLQTTLYKAVQKRGLTRVRTRRGDSYGEVVDLEVWRSDAPRGRHWSKWMRQLDRALALDVGETCAFSLAFAGELGTLQNSLHLLKKRRGVRVRTWRAEEDGHLVLHVERIG